MNSSLFVVLEMALAKDSGPIDGILGLGKTLPNGFDKVPGFLVEAGLHHFSVCMRDDGAGALRLGSDAGPLPTPKLGSIGVNHWTLGLDSVAVAGVKDSVPIC